MHLLVHVYAVAYEVDEGRGANEAPQKANMQGVSGHSMEAAAAAEAAGDAAMEGVQFDRAVKAYALARVHSSDTDLLIKQARGLINLAKSVTTRPSAESDNDRKLGPDSQTLAALAQRDLDRAISSGSIAQDRLADVYELKGDAHFALEEYAAALDTYRHGLGYDPMHAGLLAAIAKTRELTCVRSRASLKRPAVAADSLSADRSARVESDGVAPASEGQPAGTLETDDGLMCGFCDKLLFEPVTTPSGHSFCRHCLQQALSKSLRCPVTHKVLHLNARRHPVSVNLQNLLRKLHADETASRAKEVALEAAANRDTHDVLPIFTLDYIVPGQTMALNVFEPRYRLMTRRCMDGDRKFGVMGVKTGERARRVGTEVEIVEMRQLSDGRCHIQIKATSRFELVSQWEMDGYCCARVRFFSDDGKDREPPALQLPHMSGEPFKLSAWEVLLQSAFAVTGPCAGEDSAAHVEKRRKRHSEIETVRQAAIILLHSLQQRAGPTTPTDARIRRPCSGRRNW